MLKRTLFTLVISFVIPTTTFAHDHSTTLHKEPKNFKEFESALNVSMESQPYVYVITSSQFFDHIRRVFEGKDNLYKEKDTYISGASFSIPGHARSRFTNMLYLVKNPAPFATYSPLKDTRSSRPRKYFFSKFNDEMIGNMSFEHRFGIWEDSPTTDVYFIRGNCVFSVSSSKVFGLFNPPDKYGAVEMVLVADKNLLRKAWEMDQYFIRDPLSKLSEDEKSKLKTLDMSLPVKEGLTQGKEFPLEFPRRLADGTTPAEIRLVVSRGEIQQTSDVDPTLAPEIDGKYTVLFSQPGKQSVKCYHLDETGKCLVWGEVEVNVEAEK